MELKAKASLIERIQRQRQLFALLAAGSLAVMPGAVIAPVLPEIIQDLHLDHAFAGYLVSAHYLTIALFSPLLGILADRTGRIRVLVVSLVLFALFGMAGALTQSFLPMLVTRGLLGAATGGIAAASLGLLSRMYPDEAKRSQAIAYASSAITLANIAYPLLAGLIGFKQWQFAFCLYGLGLPLALVAALILRDERSPSLHAPSASNPALNPTLNPVIEEKTAAAEKLIDVLRQPQIIQLLLTLCFSAATAYAAVIYLPLYLKATLHTHTLTNGIVLAAQAIGAATASAFGASWLSRLLGTRPTIAIGLGVMALSAATVPQLQQIQGLLPIAVLFGLGLGLVVPNYYAALANLTPTKLQASVLATATGMNFLGQFLSPTLFGFILKSYGLNTVFYAVAGVALTTGLLLLMSSRTVRNL